MSNVSEDISSVVRAPGRIGTGWGFAVMLMGILAIMAPFVSGLAVSGLVAVLVVAAGLAMTAYAFKAGSFGKGLMQFLFGGITVACGVAMFAAPMQNMFTLTAVLIAWFVIDGVFTIISGIKGRPAPGWGWMTISGIASIVLAVLLYRQWPDSGTYAIGLLVGIRLIFTGWSMAMLGMASDAVVDGAEQLAEEAQ